ncbi:MAG: M1 family aminopeptidase [Bacteroidia bacterium]|nr:M1 family aminopeptidase [Bacteroidia bacterium]MDW8416775.1 M1 family aminopeptidase [Bacteroidia bacterium]
MRFTTAIWLISFLWAQQDMATRLLLNKYDVRFWWLNLQVTHTSTQIGPSWVLTRLVVTAPSLDTLTFELHSALTVDSVVVNGQKLNFLRRGHTIRIPLNPQPTQGTLLEAVVHYRGTPPNSQSSLSGIFNRQSPSWGNQVTWTLSQPFGALSWWPTKQILSDKADSVWTFLSVPMGTRAGAVGRLEGIDTLSSTRVRFRWKSRYPIVYYLVAFAVAEYVDYSFYAQIPGVSRPVLVQNYIYNNPQTLPTFKGEIDTTAALLREFSIRFGPYPFWREKYGHMMAPFSGGMEHQTMTTQGFFTFLLTAHELAHQWFGDWATCGSWQDIWLNEGFATYGEYIALQALGTPSQARSWLIDAHDYVVSEPDGSVHVSDTLDDADIFSSRLSYNKGAYLLHMIRFRLQNDSVFFAILRHYLSMYGEGNAWLGDFRNVLEAATGQSWADFFQQWYYGEGHIILSARWNEVNGNLWLILSQQGSQSSSVPYFSTPVEVSVQRQGRPDTLLRLFISQPSQAFSVAGIGTVRGIQIDPNYWILRVVSSVQRDITLGVRSSETRSPSLFIYPNPLRLGETLTIGLPSEGHVAIYDLHGRVLHEMYADALSIEWRHTLAPGAYILRWTGAQGEAENQRFLVLP